MCSGDPNTTIFNTLREICYLLFYLSLDNVDKPVMRSVCGDDDAGAIMAVNEDVFR
jgi:hypothetical protein